MRKDEKKAAELYQKAAGKENTRAIYLLAKCYEGGAGVGRDLAKARDLYRQAADKGHKKAREALAGLEASQPKPAPGKPEQKKERKGWWPFGKK